MYGVMEHLFDICLYFGHAQVKEAVWAVDPKLLAVACGSYRRGKATCGDVDVLISHPDGKSHKGVFSKVLQTLHQSGKLSRIPGINDFLMSSLSLTLNLRKTK